MGIENFKQGNVVEGKFIGKALEEGVPVFIPLGIGSRYNFVTDRNGLNRVQVKSTTMRRDNGSYDLYPSTPNNAGSGRIPYTADEIDFMVVYVVPEDFWYVFPVSVIEGKKHVLLFPHGDSKYNEYLEAWEQL